MGPGMVSTAHRLRDEIEGLIVTGVLAPGEKLDEVQLANRFAVSRTPIREALQQLAAAGFVEIRLRRGATVVRAWAGIEARMPDDLPVFGPSARHEGLFHQFGFSAHGFQLGPGAGMTMADLIVDGGTQVPIGALAIDRFAETR